MSFIPEGFVPPRHFKAEEFQLVVLSPDLAERDFNAVRTSASEIRNVFGPKNDWPNAAISFEENYADLVRHEEEFNLRKAFAYSVLDPSGTEYLGCFYVKPIKSRRVADIRKQRFQAQAFLWLSVSAVGLSSAYVVSVLARWLREQWPFGAVAFPGRMQSWIEWEELANASS